MRQKEKLHLEQYMLFKYINYIRNLPVKISECGSGKMTQQLSTLWLLQMTGIWFLTESQLLTTFGKPSPHDF